MNSKEENSEDFFSLLRPRILPLYSSLRVMIDIEGPLSIAPLLLIGKVHIGARAPLDINLICMVWLYRARTPVDRRGVFYKIKSFLPAFATLRGEGRGQHPVIEAS